MKKNTWFCVLLLVVFYAVGCTQSGPRYGFYSVDKTGLSVEEASKIDAVVLDMGNKGFSTKEVAFTKVKDNSGRERIFVTDKDGITKGRVIAGAIGGSGILNNTVASGVLNNGLRHMNTSRFNASNSSSSGATATATTGP